MLHFAQRSIIPQSPLKKYKVKEHFLAPVECCSNCVKLMAVLLLPTVIRLTHFSLSSSIPSSNLLNPLFKKIRTLTLAAETNCRRALLATGR